MLSVLRGLEGHAFRPDDLSIFDRKRIDTTRILDSKQITDTYLLALARAHGGLQASFDRHLAADAVADGGETLHMIA